MKLWLERHGTSKKHSSMHCLFLARLFVDMQAFRAPCLPVPSHCYWLNNSIDLFPHLTFSSSLIKCVCVIWAPLALFSFLVAGGTLSICITWGPICSNYPAMLKRFRKLMKFINGEATFFFFNLAFFFPFSSSSFFSTSTSFF